MSGHFLIPGDITLPTGGYGYDRQVLAAAARLGAPLSYVALPDGFPNPDDAALAETARIVASLPARTVLLIDGLAYGAMPEALIRGFDRPVVELCHHPLAVEPGLDPQTARRFAEGERAAMALARHIIVTGRNTADEVARDFGVPRSQISVALPGTERAARAVGSGQVVPRLIAVGSVIPRKGYDILVAAMERLRGLDWTLDIIGATSHAPETVAALTRKIAAAGLEERIRLAGPMTAAALDAAYASADLFVMSSLYEGYGMVIAEAMARGLPIVGTTGGAAAETLDDRAGLKVPPGDALALAAAIGTMLTDITFRARCADGSWLAGQALPSWDDTARQIIAILKEHAP
ncbi:MAG: glycosyltransferase family 4 protein [Proteobacteria bacterium]|nr:glycosyltransferase family 4 protein [Pseudomonadota bacterium]